MKRLLLLIGPPIFVLCIMAMLIVLQMEKTVPNTIFPHVSAYQKENRITGDGKNLLGLQDGETKSRLTANLLSLPPVPKLVALTFDDGPHPRYTEDLLKILREHEVRATFFMLGENVEEYPKVARAVSKAGHQIASHSYNHSYAQFSSPDLLRENVERTNAVIRSVTGIQPTAFRPPGGWLVAEIDAIVRLPIVLWSVDSRDWEVRNTEEIIRNTTEGILPGDIVILHDIYSTTVSSVPMIIETLRKQGYSFVTVDELLGLDSSLEQVNEIHFYSDLAEVYE
jgi:peptidoglycan/xylan/chitin deacetylase (PgdA/CDA1 family)